MVKTHGFPVDFPLNLSNEFSHLWVFPVSPNPSQGSSAVGFYQLIPSPHIQHPPKRNHGCFAWEFPDFCWHHAFLISFGVFRFFGWWEKNGAMPCFGSTWDTPPAPPGRVGRRKVVLVQYIRSRFTDSKRRGMASWWPSSGLTVDVM